MVVGRPIVLASLVAILVATGGTLAWAQATDDEVELVDGTTLHGQVTTQVPGSHVVIKTADGKSQSIPWGQVRRVSAAEPPAPPATTATAAAPPPPSASAAPTPSALPATPHDAPAEAPPENLASSSPPKKRIPVHFETGLRLGYTLATGGYGDGISLNSASAQQPGVNGGGAGVLDVGMRVGRYVFLGAFAGGSLLSMTCPPSPAAGVSFTSCGGHAFRGGIDVIAHILPRGSVDPWVGLGIGYEWLEIDLTATGPAATASGSEEFQGWDFADLLLGVDFRIGDTGVGLGPYIGLTVGQFATGTATVNGQPVPGNSDISNQSGHQWFTFGVRGTYEAAVERPEEPGPPEP